MGGFLLDKPRLGLRLCFGRPGVGRTFLAILVLLALAGGCRHAELRDGVFTKSKVRYRIGELPPGWKRVSLRENDLAWTLAGEGHSIAVNSTCQGYEDAPLSVLTQHLLVGFTDRQPVGQQSVMLDGREALRSHYRAKLDGAPIELLVVVMKKNSCIYDFTYVSPVGRFEERLPDFERLIQGFKSEEP
jgi:hypothetical protein